jgi:hypothetical protein
MLVAIEVEKDLHASSASVNPRVMSITAAQHANIDSNMKAGIRREDGKRRRKGVHTRRDKRSKGVTEEECHKVV